MEIIYNEPEASVKEAVDKANDLLNDDKFYQAIASHPNFALSTAEPTQIADFLKTSLLNITVEFFYPSRFFSRYRKTFAYTDSRYPNFVFLNHRKLNRSAASIAATLIHECIHALDTEVKDYTFGHGNNSSVGKGNTAPYWIGNLAYRLLSDPPNITGLAFDQEEDDDSNLS